MIVSFEAIQNGLARYLDTEVIPKMMGFKKIAFAAYVSLAAQNLAELLRSNKDHPLIALTGAVSESGVDIDKLYNALATRFTEKMDVDIPMIGRFSFSREDLDKLYNEMRV